MGGSSKSVTLSNTTECLMFTLPAQIWQNKDMNADRVIAFVGFIALALVSSKIVCDETSTRSVLACLLVLLPSFVLWPSEKISLGLHLLCNKCKPINSLL